MKFSNLLIYAGREPNPDFYYHSGLQLTHAFLLLKGRHKTIITNSVNQGLGNRFSGKYIVAKDVFKETARQVKAAGIDGKMPVHVYLKLKNKIKMTDATDELYFMRMKKTAEELAKIRKAVHATKDILRTVRITEGRSEMDVAAELLAETYKRGLEPAYAPIVATGKNAVTPHALISGKRIEDYVLIDYGVKYKQYCADITRCFFFKSKKAAAIKEKYEKLERLAYNIIDAGASMRTTKEIREYYLKENKAAGLPEPIHAIGHGIGLEVHEYPRFGAKYKDKIAGCTFTIEPGAYYGGFGLRFEETTYHNGKKIMVL
ncbi:MAG: M24 family metallopeptidase [Candidatus Micrarchaeota archaeon]